MWDARLITVIDLLMCSVMHACLLVDVVDGVAFDIWPYSPIL